MAIPVTVAPVGTSVEALPVEGVPIEAGFLLLLTGLVATFWCSIGVFQPFSLLHLVCRYNR